MSKAEGGSESPALVVEQRRNRLDAGVGAFLLALGFRFRVGAVAQQVVLWQFV